MKRHTTYPSSTTSNSCNARLLGLFFFVLLFTLQLATRAQNCDSLVPSFTVNLSSNIHAFWISPDTLRDGLCCGSNNPDVCVEFIVTLHPNAVGVLFDIYSGAVPSGSMFYQVGCSAPTSVGEPLCLNGQGPHVITFCKPGNNYNEYIITSIGQPDASPDIAVNDGCVDTIWATDYDINTIIWTSVFPGNQGTYDNYLSCTTCDTVIVNSQQNAPPFVDYQVCGFPLGGCDTNYVCDTVRVYFNNTLAVNITPINPTICFGDTAVMLTANATGGTSPYSYQWSNGATTSSIFAQVGTYLVTLSDTSGCPPTFASVTVGSFSNIIAANAGADQTVCIDNVPVQLGGSVTGVTQGQWFGGTGTYTPNATTLNAQYNPPQVEIDNGSVILYLRTLGNGSCPGDTDTVIVSFVYFDAVVTLYTQDVSCTGSNDGMCWVTFSGGTSPFTTVWNVQNNPTGDTLSGQGPIVGTYTCTDGNGCDTTLTFMIQEPTPLTQSFAAFDPNCNQSCDGYAVVIPSGGTSPYSYQWSNGATTATANGLCAGSYWLNLTDANGCNVQTNFSVVDPPLLLSIATSMDASCYSYCDGQINLSMDLQQKTGQ